MLDTKVFEVNPFSDAYVRQELEFYSLTAPYEKDGVRVSLEKLMGRVDDYFNSRFRVPADPVPVLRIDGRIWMSLTPMEVQSAALAIFFAQGEVATTGLGLGYFALRAAAKEDVERVDVYEIDQRIIDFFNDNFSHRPEFSKINIIKGDVREELTGKSYNFAFIDPYETILPDEAIDDFRFFMENNFIEQYRFWGQEAVILDNQLSGSPIFLCGAEADYYKSWLEAEVEGQDNIKLSQLYRPLTDENYRSQVLELMDYYLQ